MSQEDGSTTATTETATSGNGNESTTTTGDEARREEEQRQTFDRAYVEKLRGESAKNRTKAQEAEQRAQAAEARAKEFEDREKSESDKLREQAETAAESAERAQRELLQLRTASKKGLPSELADLLTGSTAEEMEERADFLLERLKPKGGTAALEDAGRRGGSHGGGKSMDDLIRGRAGVRTSG
jgi:membrane protein involved in colicin uptake